MTTDRNKIEIMTINLIKPFFVKELFSSRSFLVRKNEMNIEKTRNNIQ